MEPSNELNYYVEPRYQVHTLTLEEFKEQCLDFVSKIASADDDQTIKVIIFDGDEPVALLTRYKRPQLPEYPPIEVEILGDIVSPMPSEWFKTWKEMEEEASR